MNPAGQATICAEDVAKRFAAELRLLRTAIDETSRVGDAAQHLNSARVAVKALTDRHLNLVVAVTSDLTAECFQGQDIEPEAVTVFLVVGAYHRTLNQPMRVPESEADSWASAIFGEQAESTYCVSTPRSKTFAGLPPARHYRLYLDSRGDPTTPPTADPHRLLSAPANEPAVPPITRNHIERTS